MTKLSNKLLADAGDLAFKKSKMATKLSEAFENRYGINYSDADCDWLIDYLDYGQGVKVTLEIADKHMTEAGHPPFQI